MATTLYLANPTTAERWSDGAYHTRLAGNDAVWLAYGLTSARGSGAATATRGSVSGPTNGIEAGSFPYIFISAPLAADTTISGTVTLNLRAAESNMSANAAVNARVFRIDVATKAWTEILKTARTTELGTSEAAANFTATPTSTAFNRGDRIAVVPFFGDAGTMAPTYTLTLWYNGTTAGASGDSYITFNEDLTFEGTPAGSTVYLTGTSAGINPGSATELEAWTSRGSGVTTAVTATVAGATDPIQITDTSGGTAVEWYTKQLTATTLSGAVYVHFQSRQSALAANTQFLVEIARTDADGSNAVVWGWGAMAEETVTTESLDEFYISGDDLAISDGQRLRIRVFLDDAIGVLVGQALMGSGETGTVYYAGTSGGGSGDTYLTFPITLTEYVVAGDITVTPTTKALTTALFAPTVTASDHQSVTPTTKALTTATFAPTVTASDHQSVTPTTKALTTATFAPTVSATQHQQVTPSTAALTTTKYAPTVTATAHETVTPTTAALSTSPFAPTVTASDHQSVTPTTRSLTTATFAPTVTASNNQSVTPSTASLTTGTFAPTVSATQNVQVTPATASLTTSAFAPTVTASDHQSVTPSTASLSLTAFAPTVAATANVTATPDTASLATETFAPTASVTAHQTVTPDAAGLVTEAFEPTVTATSGQVATPDPASLTLAAFAPTVSATAHQTVVPSPASLTLTTFIPGVGQPTSVAPDTASLTLETFAPSVALTDNQLITPAQAALALSSFAPEVSLGGSTVVVPGVGVLVITTYAPTLGGQPTSIEESGTMLHASILAVESFSGGIESGAVRATITSTPIISAELGENG